MLTELYVITSTKDKTTQVAWCHTLGLLQAIVELQQRNGFVVTVVQYWK